MSPNERPRTLVSCSGCWAPLAGASSPRSLWLFPAQHTHTHTARKKHAPATENFASPVQWRPSSTGKAPRAFFPPLLPTSSKTKKIEKKNFFFFFFSYQIKHLEKFFSRKFLQFFLLYAFMRRKKNKQHTDTFFAQLIVLVVLTCVNGKTRSAARVRVARACNGI